MRTALVEYSSIFWCSTVDTFQEPGPEFPLKPPLLLQIFKQHMHRLCYVHVISVLFRHLRFIGLSWHTARPQLAATVVTYLDRLLLINLSVC